MVRGGMLALVAMALHGCGSETRDVDADAGTADAWHDAASLWDDVRGAPSDAGPGADDAAVDRDADADSIRRCPVFEPYPPERFPGPCEYEFPFEDTVHLSVYTYDRRDLLERVVTYDAYTREVYQTEVFTHSADRTVTTVEGYYGELDEADWTETQTWGEHGMVREEWVSAYPSAHIAEYEYDDDGCLLKVTETWPYEHVQVEHEVRYPGTYWDEIRTGAGDFDHLVSYRRFNRWGDLLEFMSENNGWLERRIVYEYDDAGNRLRATAVAAEDQPWAVYRYGCWP